MRIDRSSPVTELLPCPFCGLPPIVLETKENDDFVRYYKVRCDHCGIGQSEEYRSATVELWNTRASQPATPTGGEGSFANVILNGSGDVIADVAQPARSSAGSDGAAATTSVLAASREEILQTFDAAYREKMPFHSGHERQVAIEAGIDAILSLCTRPVAQPSWQPIETAPKDGTRILLFQGKRGAFEGWWHDGWPSLESYWMDVNDSEPEPTHWQPTLALPSTEGK